MRSVSLTRADAMPLMVCGSGSKRGNCGQGLCGIRNIPHIRLNTSQIRRTCHFDVVPALCDGAAHFLKNIEKGNVALFGTAGDILDADRPAANGRRGKKIGGCGGVGFNGIDSL